MNRRNTNRVRDHIAGLPPERFDMLWRARDLVTDTSVEPDELVTNCGTCGCVAGWANAIGRGDGSFEWAERWMGLDRSNKERDLFYPPPEHPAWTAPPAVIVAVIDDMLARKSGQADWTIAETVEA